MESLELRIFREVAYSGSITKAAESMGYVQSNVTAHIKKLETELNTPLLIRHKNGITLTADGERLLLYAENIIALLDQASQQCQPCVPALRLATTQTIAGYLLPKCLQDIQHYDPNCSLSVTTLSHSELERQFIKKEIDCIITNHVDTVIEGTLVCKETESLLLIAPDSCQSINDIYDFPVLVNHIQGCPYRNILIQWWKSKTNQYPAIMELDTVEAILYAVELGLGVSLVPKHTLYKSTLRNRYYLKELQTSMIVMWVRENQQNQLCERLKNCLLTQLREE